MANKQTVILYIIHMIQCTQCHISTPSYIVQELRTVANTSSNRSNRNSLQAPMCSMDCHCVLYQEYISNKYRKGILFSAPDCAQQPNHFTITPSIPPIQTYMWSVARSHIAISSPDSVPTYTVGSDVIQVEGLIQIKT